MNIFVKVDGWLTSLNCWYLDTPLFFLIMICNEGLAYCDVEHIIATRCDKAITFSTSHNLDEGSIHGILVDVLVTGCHIKVITSERAMD